MAYKIKDRMQRTFLPTTVDDYVGQHDPVRVYDAFVEALNIQRMGISVTPYKAGAEEYYPKDMLKLIIYGYSYGDKSSRKLERACHHNLSFIWLMGNLKPDYRTIARFRTEHKEAIKKVLKQCVRMCIELELIDGNVLFTDGSAIRGNASIKNTWDKERCQKHLKKIDARINELLDESQRIDKEEEQQISLVEVKEEIADQKEQKKRIAGIIKTLEEKEKSSQERQKISHNTVDEGCVNIKSRQGTHAAYNAQITVDGKHGLIINSEAISHSQDANQLSRQVEQSADILGKKPKIACSDAGYYSPKDLAKIDKDIIVVIPSQEQAKRDKSGISAEPFRKENFKYDASRDEYLCPEEKSLRYKSMFNRGRHEGSRKYQAKGKECQQCPRFKECTRSLAGRSILRMKEEELQKSLAELYRTDKGQEIYKLRKEKVELPFGHIKHNLQAGHFLLRGKKGADAELSILSTCFNIARMITLIGISGLIMKLKLA